MKDFICKKCGNTTYIMREKLNGTGKAIVLYCAKCGTWHKWLNKQEKVLYSTHSAESDCVADSKAVQTITDLLIEFDEMGFAPTTVCPNPEQYATEWRERVRKEFARLTGENDNLTVELEVAQRDVENLTRTLEEANDEIKALEAENEELRATLSKMEKVEKELRARLEKAVELPCIEPMTTWDWDDTTGLGKNNFGKYWQVLYRNEDGEFIAYIGATKEEAEAQLAELKGGKQ